MILIKLEKIEELRDIALRVSQVMYPDRIQGGEIKNPVEEYVMKKFELTKALEEEIEKYKILQKNIIALINTLDDDLQKKILDLRYIHFKKWEEIGDLLHYDSKWLINIHKRAINSLANIFKDFLTTH